MTKKIAISLPEAIFKAVERERRGRKQTRSEFFRYAVLALLSRERERLAIEQYVRAYREEPESAPEIAAADGMGSFQEEPWE